MEKYQYVIVVLIGLMVTSVFAYDITPFVYGSLTMSEFFDDFSTNTTSNYETYYWPYGSSQGADVSIIYDASNERVILHGYGGYGHILMKQIGISSIPPSQDFEFSYDMEILREYCGFIYLGDLQGHESGTWLRFGIDSYQPYLLLEVYENGEGIICETQPTGLTACNLKVKRENGTYYFYCNGNLIWSRTIGALNSIPFYYGAWTAISSGPSGFTAEIAMDNWRFLGGVVQATIDIDPNTLNLKSQGIWITCYIEPPEGYSVEDIDTSTVALSAIDDEPIEPIYREGPTEIGDYDEDGISDLMVKFDRQELIALLEELINPPADVELTVSGELNDVTLFEGSDTVHVIRPGGGPQTPGEGSLTYNFTFYENYPNPFNSETEIRYTLPKGSYVILKIYNLAGKFVRTLVDDHKMAGIFTAHWDGRDASGREVISGIYFYRIQSGSYTSMKKMILVR